mmetsp:Transcript_15920/g.61974  ORF Transcript_15920/g.61974 Transcript_15920/m.61974 type:complete len:406 (+) Transcript_15920:1621-2838(+)
MAWSLALVPCDTSEPSLAVSSLSSESESSWGPFIFFDLIDLMNDASAGGTFSVVASFTLGDDPMKLSGSTAIVLYARAFRESSRLRTAAPGESIRARSVSDARRRRPPSDFDFASIPGCPPPAPPPSSSGSGLAEVLGGVSMGSPLFLFQSMFVPCLAPAASRYRTASSWPAFVASSSAVLVQLSAELMSTHTSVTRCVRTFMHPFAAATCSAVVPLVFLELMLIRSMPFSRMHDRNDGRLSTLACSSITATPAAFCSMALASACASPTISSSIVRLLARMAITSELASSLSRVVTYSDSVLEFARWVLMSFSRPSLATASSVSSYSMTEPLRRRPVAPLPETLRSRGLLNEDDVSDSSVATTYTEALPSALRPTLTVVAFLGSAFFLASPSAAGLSKLPPSVLS